LTLAENFFKIVEKRRSIRKYKQREIPPEHLKKILEAARLAPSARNAQPWRFIVVKDQKMKGFLAKAVGGQGFLADASVVIVILGNPDTAPYWFTRDPMIAAEHMVLAATALGYGTCWIGALADYVPENMDDVKKSLNIPEKITVVCLVTVGVPDEKPTARPRKYLQEICFDEVYGKPLKFS
jgi:nitroreductase